MRTKYFSSLSFVFFFFLVSCSSSDDPNNPGSGDCTLTPDLFIDNITEFTDTSAMFSGTIIAPTCESTVTSQGFVYATTTLPKIDDFVIEVAGENISAEASNLQPNTTYYVRTFFVNPTGEYYSEQIEFTTAVGEINIATKEATNITFESATSGSIISSDGGSTILNRGLCWSTSQNPTLNDNFIESGSGVGNYNENITGLEDESTYYVRAFITNEFGTLYGNEISFTTPFEEIIFDGSVSLCTQSDVDAFGANGYTVITGYISIGCNDNPPLTNITNLDALSTITSVESLYIFVNSLTDLNGLNNLNTVNDYLTIYGNDLLTNIDALNNLSGLINLTDVGGSLSIQNNDNLNDLCGITNIITNGEYSSYYVSGNAYNPSEQDIINGNCSN